MILTSLSYLFMKKRRLDGLPHIPDLNGAVLASRIHPATFPLKTNRSDIASVSIKACHLSNATMKSKSQNK